MLATLGVPFDADAAAYAVDTAVESGELLLVVNATQLEPLPMSLRLGYDALEEFTPEVTASLKRPVRAGRVARYQGGADPSAKSAADPSAPPTHRGARGGPLGLRPGSHPDVAAVLPPGDASDHRGCSVSRLGCVGRKQVTVRVDFPLAHDAAVSI